MQTGSATAERMQLEAAFRQRRARVLRAEAGVVAAFLLGLLLVFATKGSAPQHLDAVIAAFVVLLYGSMANVWRIARRHWRCPSCDVRWQTRETLASLQWNHCPACGEALVVHPRERDRERGARIAFEIQALSHEELLRRFSRRRRRALWLAGALVLAGVAVLVWLQGRGLEEWMLNGVMAGFGGGVAATLLYGMRCPRCRGGVLAEGRHCMRCGFQLEPFPHARSEDTAGLPPPR